MNPSLAIEADWEQLSAGSQEERAAFAAIGIRYNDLWLTEAEDAFVKRVRQKVHISGYRLAEWFAWHWWRLRWEPRRRSNDWAMAHRMTTIGGGYIWPNITIVSDGERIVLAAEPTEPQPAAPLRYITRLSAVVPVREFESALDLFVEQVIGQLRAEKVPETNLDEVWCELLEERRTPHLARRRKLEALLGYDVDEADESVIERLLDDATQFGEPAVQELAADRDKDHDPVTANEINTIAEQSGAHTSPRDVVQLRERSQATLPVDVAAWKRGAFAAQAIRDQEGLGGGPISDEKLCNLVAVSSAVIQATDKAAPVSFVLDRSPTDGVITLRSRYVTGRRFNLARLLGDRIAAPSQGALRPATNSYTYRQKLQRSFAAEFLCPYESLADFLGSDSSGDAVQDAALHFNVSERTIRTHLVNHKRIDRADLFGDFDFVA